MTTDHHDDDHELHPVSPTDHVLTELQLKGYRPFQDEPDPRPLPEARTVGGAVADIFDALGRDPDRHPPRTRPRRPAVVDRQPVPPRQWPGRARARRQRAGAERCQREQDGSEIRSVELERLTAEGMTLIERRNVMEFFRDQAAGHFATLHRIAWHPRKGSMVNHRTLTAAMIDSRDFIAAKRRAETEVMLPPGPKIAFTGGSSSTTIADLGALDQVHAKHPDMVLLHGGSPKGAERIAACWADARKVPQVAFKPDWARHAKAAPFKRNDAMLEALPIGVLVTPGSGIQANLADKARRLGIPVWKLGSGGA